MSKYKAILDGLISTAYKIGGDTEIAELLNSDEESLDEKAVLAKILEADKNRIKEISTAKFNDGHKKGKSEALNPLEKSLREKYQITEDLQGEELINAIVEKQASKSGKELEVDQIKRSKVYIELQDAMKKQLDDLKANHQAEIDKITKGYQKEKIFTSVSDKAMAIFNGLNPILSEDPVKAAKQRSILLNELKGYEYEDQDGKIVILKDGKVLEDEHGHRVAFEDLVKSTASNYFDFKVSKEDRSAPHQNPGKDKKPDTAGQTKYSGVMPKNEAEYMEIISNETIPLAERLDLKATWAQQQQNK